MSVKKDMSVYASIYDLSCSITDIKKKIARLEDVIDEKKDFVTERDIFFKNISKFAEKPGWINISEILNEKEREFLSSLNAIKQTTFSMRVNVNRFIAGSPQDNINIHTVNGQPCYIIKQILSDDYYRLIIIQDALKKGIIQDENLSMNINSKKMSFKDHIVQEILKKEPIVYHSSYKPGPSRFDISPDLKKCGFRLTCSDTCENSFTLEIDVFYYSDVENDAISQCKANEQYQFVKMSLCANIDNLNALKKELTDKMDELKKMKGNNALPEHPQNVHSNFNNMLNKKVFCGYPRENIQHLQDIIQIQKAHIYSGSGLNRDWICVCDNPKLYKMRLNYCRNITHLYEMRIKEYVDNNNIEIFANEYGKYFVSEEFKDIINIEVGRDSRDNLSLNLTIDLYFVKSDMATVCETFFISPYSGVPI